MNSNDESKFLYHSPCSDCGSKDNLGIYTDHTYCFGCKITKYFNSQETAPQNKIQKEVTDMIDGVIQALPKRKINELLRYTASPPFGLILGCPKGLSGNSTQG